MHGAGNDFIIVEPEFFGLANRRSAAETFSPEELGRMSPAVVELCRPRFGIGADGVLVVSELGDRFKMTVINADGSTALNCGNGLRCVAAYLFASRKLASRFVVATDSGDKEVEVQVAASEDKGKEYQVSIDLGPPGPVEELPRQGGEHPLLQEYLRKARIFHSGLGNNHLIVFLDRLSFQRIESAQAFAEISAELVKWRRANVNFCLIESRESMRIVTCELGAGVTLACGTGSTVSAFVGHAIG